MAEHVLNDKEWTEYQELIKMQSTILKFREHPEFESMIVHPGPHFFDTWVSYPIMFNKQQTDEITRTNEAEIGKFLRGLIEIISNEETANNKRMFPCKAVKRIGEELDRLQEQYTNNVRKVKP